MTLSVELQELIFDALPDIEDIICFSLMNKHMFLVGRKRFHEYWTNMRGRLAGQCIVHLECEGGVKDTPPGLYTPEEIDEFSETNQSVYRNIYSNTNPMAIDYDTFERIQPGRIEALSRIAFSMAWNRNRNNRSFQVLEPKLICHEFEYFPTNKAWVLRDLTAKEYVRAQDIALRPEFIHGPNIDVLGFGAIVAARTCWINRSSMNIELPAGASALHKGPWAGHKLDITTWDSLVERGDFSEWTDASPAVNNEMNALGTKTLGPNWRDILTEMWQLAFQIGGEDGLGDGRLPINFLL